jgi:hypothetical protein
MPAEAVSGRGLQIVHELSGGQDLVGAGETRW